MLWSRRESKVIVNPNFEYPTQKSVSFYVYCCILLMLKIRETLYFRQEHSRCRRSCSENILKSTPILAKTLTEWKLNYFKVVALSYHHRAVGPFFKRRISKSALSNYYHLVVNIVVLISQKLGCGANSLNEDSRSQMPSSNKHFNTRKSIHGLSSGA